LLFFVIYKGYKLKVRFGVGKLLVKDKRVAFIFDKELRINKNKKTFNILPNSMTVAADSEIGELLHEASDGGSSFPSSRPPSRSLTPRNGTLKPLSKSLSAPQLDSTVNSTVPNLDLTTVNNGDVPETSRSQATEDDGLLLSNPTFRTNEDDEEYQNDVTAFNADRSCVFAVSEKYRGGANPDRLDRTAMRDALALAYERHLIDVEAELADEEKQADHWRYQLWERELAYRKEAEKRENDLKMLDEYLVKQIVEQKKRLNDDYLDNTCKLEKGKAYPDFRRLKRLAKRYGVYKDSEGRYIQATVLPEGGKFILYYFVRSMLWSKTELTY
jgi:hypothetical protein